MEQQDIGHLRRLACREEGLQGEVLIRLVDDEEDVRIAFGQTDEAGLIRHLPRGVVRIAKPKHLQVFRQPVVLRPLEKGSDPMPMDAAGIGIFAERGLQHGTSSSRMGLGDEVDGFRGSIGRADLVGTDTPSLCQTGFERIGLRLRISGYRFAHVLTQVVLQRCRVYPIGEIGTEIGNNRTMVFVQVVSVSFYHNRSVVRILYNNGILAWARTCAASLSYCSSLKAW